MKWVLLLLGGLLLGQVGGMLVWGSFAGFQGCHDEPPTYDRLRAICGTTPCFIFGSMALYLGGTLMGVLGLRYLKVYTTGLPIRPLVRAVPNDLKRAENQGILLFLIASICFLVFGLVVADLRLGWELEGNLLLKTSTAWMASLAISAFLTRYQNLRAEKSNRPSGGYPEARTRLSVSNSSQVLALVVLFVGLSMLVGGLLHFQLVYPDRQTYLRLSIVGFLICLLSAVLLRFDKREAEMTP